MSLPTWRGVVLIAFGIAAMVLGLRGGPFYIRLPGLQQEARKPVPAWLGRLWFTGLGLLALYWGLTLTAGSAVLRNGQHTARYTQHDILLAGVGLAAIVFGLRSSRGDGPGLPGTKRSLRPLARWFWRLWFMAFGALLVYGGMRHWH